MTRSSFARDSLQVYIKMTKSICPAAHARIGAHGLEDSGIERPPSASGEEKRNAITRVLVHETLKKTMFRLICEDSRPTGYTGVFSHARRGVHHLTPN